METPTSLKLTQLSHLNWWLEKLKYRPETRDEELHRCI